MGREAVVVVEYFDYPEIEEEGTEMCDPIFNLVSKT